MICKNIDCKYNWKGRLCMLDDGRDFYEIAFPYYCWVIEPENHDLKEKKKKTPRWF